MESGNEENCDFKCSRTEGNACNILKTHKRMGEHDDDGGGDDDDNEVAVRTFFHLCSSLVFAVMYLSVVHQTALS